MGGITVTILADIPRARRKGAFGNEPGRGHARVEGGETYEVCNLDFDNDIPAGKRALINHVAGGEWHIGRVE